MMFYKKGDEGETVAKIQKRLEGLGFYATLIDGIFGMYTHSAVVNFQKERELNADGIVGPKTWSQLFNEVMPYPDTPNPLFQKNLKAILGDPKLSGFRDTWIVPFDLRPWKPHFGSLGIPNDIWVNKIIVEPLGKVFEALAMSGLAKEIVTYDGCWWVRNSRGKPWLSTHSYGVSIDLNAGKNPLKGTMTWSKDFVGVWCSLGWEPGASWLEPFDPMHFQWCWTRDWRRNSYGRTYVPQFDGR